MNVTVHEVDSDEDLTRAWDIRRRVFVQEQGVSPAEEIDGKDTLPTTHHILAVAGEKAVGTARVLHTDNGVAYIGRVAVLDNMRSHGIGGMLMDAAEDVARRRCADASGAVTVKLSAQVTALDFYRNRGYTVLPEQYFDARILHQDAEKQLQQ